MTAKNIVLRPISMREATSIVTKYHYSGGVKPNSQINMGVYYAGKLEGAMQFGPSIDKRKTAALVEGTGWDECIELNRMAFSPALPRNSESRALSVAMRLLRKHAPKLQWVISFADGTQCGDGTIYRASGFLLTQIKRNAQMLNWNGKIIARKTLDNANYPKINGRYYSRHLIDTGEATPLEGYQLRYVYFLNPDARKRLTVPEIPYSEIDRMNARMYLGQRRESVDSDTPDIRSGEGGASPTSRLHDAIGNNNG